MLALSCISHLFKVYHITYRLRILSDTKLLQYGLMSTNQPARMKVVPSCLLLYFTEYAEIGINDSMMALLVRQEKDVKPRSLK